MNQAGSLDTFKLTPLTDIPLKDGMMLIPFFHEPT